MLSARASKWVLPVCGSRKGPVRFMRPAMTRSRRATAPAATENVVFQLRAIREQSLTRREKENGDRRRDRDKAGRGGTLPRWESCCWTPDHRSNGKWGRSRQKGFWRSSRRGSVTEQHDHTTRAPAVGGGPSRDAAFTRRPPTCHCTSPASSPPPERRSVPARRAWGNAAIRDR